ncbi:MAG: Spy/CpxP family protein refolding chaperone [Halioglobus sp.]
MSPTLFKLIPGTALISILLLSAGAWSMGPRPEHNVDKILAHLSDELALSSAQEQQINVLVDESKEAGAADIVRLSEIREQMKAMRNDFDAGKAQQLADELGEISGRMAYRMASTQADVYQLLSPQQRAELTALSEKRDQRMEKRWARSRD